MCIYKSHVHPNMWIYIFKTHVHHNMCIYKHMYAITSYINHRHTITCAYIKHAYYIALLIRCTSSLVMEVTFIHMWTAAYMNTCILHFGICLSMPVLTSLTTEVIFYSVGCYQAGWLIVSSSTQVLVHVWNCSKRQLALNPITNKVLRWR